MKFEWDANKEEENIRKHDVGFSEAETSFADPFGFVACDSSHSSKELRWFWFGRSSRGRILTVRYTQRGQTIRIIGAGAWRGGKSLYEKMNKTTL